MTQRISTIEDLRQGLEWLVSRDALLASAHQRFGDPPLRRHAPGLASLVRIIIGQQVSTASAAAISARFDTAFPTLSGQALVLASDAAFRETGLSRPKVTTLRALGAAMQNGLDLDPPQAEQAAFRAKLLAIHGIGPWTADLYELECLGLVDCFPAADLALQESWRVLANAQDRPNAKALVCIAERWRPWRAVAARLLWHSYRGLKTSNR